VLNRSVLVIRYKQPFLDWINASDPASSPALSLASANDDNTAYLVEVEDVEELEEWLEVNGEILFESELNEWYTDPALWPADRSLEVLRKWCAFELHSVVMDTGASPLYDDED
jgi:hypothetical protein